MNPTWAYLLVGLAGGAIGSLLTTWMRISYDRGAELRLRMIEAADQFSTGTLEALARIRNAAGEIRKDAAPLDDGSWWREDIREVLDAGNDAVDDLLAKQARVHLLFGDQSDAGVAATAIGVRLRNLNGTLEQRPDSIRDHNTMSAYSRYFDEVREQHATVNSAALAALKQTWWSQRLSRLSRSKNKELAA
jgi:hypothetical protein